MYPAEAPNRTAFPHNMAKENTGARTEGWNNTGIVHPVNESDIYKYFQPSWADLEKGGGPARSWR